MTAPALLILAVLVTAAGIIILTAYLVTLGEPRDDTGNEGSDSLHNGGIR